MLSSRWDHEDTNGGRDLAPSRPSWAWSYLNFWQTHASSCLAPFILPTSVFPAQNDEYFKRIPEATEDELDMLDLAFGLTDK